MRVIQFFPIQADPALLHHTTALATAGYDFTISQHIQHSLAILECKLGHIVGYLTLLENLFEGGYAVRSPVQWIQTHALVVDCMLFPGKIAAESRNYTKTVLLLYYNIWTIVNMRFQYVV